eukprot:CAMPEP_0119137240 /NCGR_PEP_ID=MMETSP1310-20130426/23219_1 /TAXON_ID=464262 /ORGANISM="Genus nov. species nov., Strain RCC2339" /LENGTH=125 /DNA_ID=CAMNT_0007128307 /DNA_START=29 /DNA_END=402 /DNA_ORIENTATION=-
MAEEQAGPRKLVKRTLNGVEISHPNFRDVMGHNDDTLYYVCDESGQWYRVKKGMLYRSSALSRIRNQEDITVLTEEIKLRTLIDLRYGDQLRDIGMMQRMYRIASDEEVRATCARNAGENVSEAS